MPRRRRRARRNPLAPPNLNNLLKGLTTYKPPADLDTQVENRLKLETGGAVNAINRARAMGQHSYRLQADEARGWQTALVGMLTGGKQGQEAMDYSKENFGGSYLAGIAMQEGTRLLTQITNDFNEQDWKFAAELSEIYDQMPELRDEIRNDILKEGAELHQMNFDNRLKLTSLVLDDWYKRVSLNMAANELGFNQQLATAKLGQDEREIRRRRDAENRQLRAQIHRENQDRRDANKIDIAMSKDLGIWVNKDGQPVKPPKGYPKRTPPRWKPNQPKSGPGSKNSAERRDANNQASAIVAGITRDELTVEDPTAPPGTGGRKRMSRAQARDYLYDAVVSELSGAGYTPAEINQFVNKQLRSKGYAAPKPPKKRKRRVKRRNPAAGPGF